MDSGSVHLPLSFGQEQLWFLDQMSPGEATYNVYGAYRLHGQLQPELLRQALTIVVCRHASLRASFRAADGVPYQVIAPEAEVELPVDDLSSLADTTRENAAVDDARAQALLPFDLAAAPLYRFRLWRLSPTDHIFLFCFHHIVTDGWSNGVVMRDVAVAYRALSEGHVPELAAPEHSYAEHVAAQRDRLTGDALEQELHYWTHQLADLPVLDLPADRLRSASPARTGDAVVHDLPVDLARGLHALARAQGISLFAVLAAGLNTVFHRYTGQPDIGIGVPMLGRTEEEQEDIVGLFVNMVVLRSDLAGDPTFLELLKRTADAVADLHDHQEVPFETVVTRVRPAREPGRNPLFQVSMQVVADFSTGTSIDLPGVRAELTTLPLARSMFDLVCDFFAGPEDIHARFSYATDLFDRWRIEALLGHLEQVLTAALDNPSVRLSELTLLTGQERARVLAAGRGESMTYTGDPLHVTIAEVASAAPDALAAVCRDQRLTYRELDRGAERLARLLRAHGVGHEELIAIAMDRDLDSLVAMLGVLKAGAAFTVLDPSHPAKRLDYILRDTATRVVLTRSSVVDTLPLSADHATVLLDTDWAAEVDDAQPLVELATQDSLAYVLYTSGSTGQPKGVLIEHRALRCFIEAYRRSFDLDANDRLLQFGALTFDMSMGEIFCALTIGAQLVLVSSEEARAPDGLAALMRTQRVSYAGFPPAMLSLLEAGPFPDLKYVMGGAEAVSAELVNKWNLPGRRFLDLYGPTEAAVSCTEYECEHREWHTPPPIGHPELNRIVYIVDPSGNLVPRGVPGELLIGGDEGLARGYLNLPELTASRFVPDPFRQTGKVYRSGDLVRWRADYEIEFLGRMDNQVKLHGLRIELGEIESAMRTHPGVAMAVTLLRSDPRGDARLVGYYTGTEQGTPTPAEVRAQVADRLPDYMVPSAWVALAEFPLTPARKVDRAALPEPEQDSGDRRFSAPATPTETEVAAVFADVLALERVGAEENLFDLGGGSLQGMRVASRLSKSFGVTIGVRLLYGSSSVAEIAATIDDLVRSADNGTAADG